MLAIVAHSLYIIKEKVKYDLFTML
jgi:hypothetical protein